MATLSVAVMAHEKRADLVPELVDRLGIGDDQVVWDSGNNNRWDTGRRAMLAHDPDADFHMVIQDDAVVCRDLIPGLQAALDHVPPDALVCPYVGTRRPMAERVEAAVEQAEERRASWIVMQTLNWGVAIVVPTRTIPDMIAWADKLAIPNYDKRVGQYYWRRLNWPTWHPWPSLVDHRDVPSLSGHGPDRHAHRFAGEDVSALDLPWDGPQVMAIDWLTRGRRRQMRRAGYEGRPLVRFTRVTGPKGRYLIVPAGSDRDRRLSLRTDHWIREELGNATV